MKGELFEPTGAAEISDDKRHRFMLSRVWEPGGDKVMFIGVNPSRADAVKNDATIVRCINFAKAWDFGGMFFANLFSFRTPYVYKTQAELDYEGEKDCPYTKDGNWPALMEHLDEAHNQETDLWMDKMFSSVGMVVCAWGSWPFISQRAKDVMAHAKLHHAELHCFGTNKGNFPKHPLYLSKETKPVFYEPI